MKKILLTLLFLPILLLSNTYIHERVDILKSIKSSDLKKLKEFKKINYNSATNSNFISKFKNNYLVASLYIPYIVKHEIDKIILNNIDDEYKKKIENFENSTSINIFDSVLGISVAGKRKGKIILNGEVILALKGHFLPKLLNYIVDYSKINRISGINNYKMIILTDIKKNQIEKIEKTLVNASSKIETVKKLSKISISDRNKLYLVEYDNNSSDIIYIWKYGFIISHISLKEITSKNKWFMAIGKIININSKLKRINNNNNNNIITFIAKNIFLGKKRRDININIKKVKNNDLIDVKISQNSLTHREKRKFNKIVQNWNQSRFAFAFALNINKKLTPKFKDFLYKLLVNSTMNKNKKDYKIFSKI